MQVMAQVAGLKSINLPTQKYYDEGVVGVALFEDYCVLLFSMTQEEVDKGLVSLTLLSRFNMSYAIAMPALPSENVHRMVDKYRKFCAGGQEFEDATQQQETKQA
jgi:hypothetical protein